MTTVFLLPAAQIGVRSLIIDHSGIEQAGHWQAAAKVGEVLLMIAMLYVSTRALPAIVRAPKERFRIAVRGAGLVMAVVSIVSVVVLALDTRLVSLLFTADFAPVQRLLGWQLAGDTLRSGVIVIQAAFIGAGRLWPYIAIDVLLALSTVGAASLLVSSFGPSAGAIAAALAGAVTLPVAIGLARRLPQEKAPL